MNWIHAGTATLRVVQSGIVALIDRAQEITGLFTYNRGTSAPFAVSNSSAAVVTNLDADKLDGNHASAFATSGHAHTGMVDVSGTPTAGRVAKWADANTVEDAGYAASDVALKSLTLAQFETSAFLAYNSVTDSDVTGDNTVYTIIFDTEDQDVGGNYDNTTGIFTAPYTGFYLFSANALFRGVDIASHSECDLDFVVVGTSARTYVFAIINMISGITDYVINNTAIVYMTATDTCKVTATVFGSSKTADIYGTTALYTRFSGIFMG